MKTTVEVIHTHGNGTEHRSRVSNVERVTVRLATRSSPYTVKVDYIDDHGRDSSVTYQGDVAVIV
jgi:hypothetical protein